MISRLYAQRCVVWLRRASGDDKIGQLRRPVIIALAGVSFASLPSCVAPDPTEIGGGTAADTSGTTSPDDVDGELPNIDVLMTRDLVEDSLWTTTEAFEPDHCAIEEGCVAQGGERRLLRFSTYTPNLGAADFVVGSPELEPERFEWNVCHEHWHFLDYAQYRLLDPQGVVVASGHKASFSLVDLAPWLADAGTAKFPLEDGTQGISVGWADAYVSQIDCQWIDITGIPAGDYQLEITVNPDAEIAESDHLDNTLVVAVSLTDVDSGPPGPPDDWRCPFSSYGADNVCDCGCGAFDPDCANPTAAACERCNQAGSCAVNEVDCSSIAPNNNAMCL